MSNVWSERQESAGTSPLMCANMKQVNTSPMTFREFPRVPIPQECPRSDFSPESMFELERSPSAHLFTPPSLLTGLETPFRAVLLLCLGLLVA